jgi:hypothetical protein
MFKEWLLSLLPWWVLPLALLLLLTAVYLVLVVPVRLLLRFLPPEAVIFLLALPFTAYYDSLD